MARKKTTKTKNRTKTSKTYSWWILDHTDDVIAQNDPMFTHLYHHCITLYCEVNYPKFKKLPPEIKAIVEKFDKAREEGKAVTNIPCFKMFAEIQKLIPKTKHNAFRIAVLKYVEWRLGLITSS